MAETEWWTGRDEERYWCEVTERTDLGADLKCPQTNDVGESFWGYDLIRLVRPGDVVFHYKDKGIVGASRVTGSAEAAPIRWHPRGTAGRSKPDSGEERPGWRVSLTGLVPVRLALAELRDDERWIRNWLAAVKPRAAKGPFLVQAGQLRAAQTYLAKFPADFVARWSPLTTAATQLGAPPPNALPADVDEPTADPSELQERVRLIRLAQRQGARVPTVGNERPERTTTSITTYKRLASVVAEVLRRANGLCECCGNRPFIGTGGDPFLEVHHVETLAEGGPDVPGNAVALCPTCHRALHHALDRRERRETLYQTLTFLRRPPLATGGPRAL
jgi:hypothetical protein